VGRKDFIARVDQCRKRVGGGMRQAGVIAACGIVALETMIDRLAEDHANARLLAQGINDIPGLRVDMSTVETNMAYVDHTGTGLSTAQILERLKGQEVLASGRPPEHIRLVTNRHHDRNTVAEVLERIRKALHP
jgi:threonine aldolase